jgi:hypothetical protein
MYSVFSTHMSAQSFVHKVYIAKHDSCVLNKNRKLAMDEWPSSLNLCRSSANSHRQSSPLSLNRDSNINHYCNSHPDQC